MPKIRLQDFPASVDRAYSLVSGACRDQSNSAVIAAMIWEFNTLLNCVTEGALTWQNRIEHSRAEVRPTELNYASDLRRVGGAHRRALTG